MFFKHISFILDGYDRYNPSTSALDYPRWETHKDADKTEHYQIIGARFWDEIQIKAPGKGDYERHIIVNAFQRSFQRMQVKTTRKGQTSWIDVNKYSLMNILEAGWLLNHMYEEALHIIRNLADFTEGFSPEIVLMNLYGLQNWPNAHFHIFGGQKNDKYKYWSVLTDLRSALQAKSLEPVPIKGYTGAGVAIAVKGTRNSPASEENLLAVDLSQVAIPKNLKREIEIITGILQPDLTPEQRKSPAVCGFGGYGSLILLPDRDWQDPALYYLIRPIGYPR